MPVVMAIARKVHLVLGYSVRRPAVVAIEHRLLDLELLIGISVMATHLERAVPDVDDDGGEAKPLFPSDGLDFEVAQLEHAQVRQQRVGRHGGLQWDADEGKDECEIGRDAERPGTEISPQKAVLRPASGRRR